MTNLIGKKCIFRGDRSGVFYGELVERNGKKLKLRIVEGCGTGMELVALVN